MEERDCTNCKHYESFYRKRKDNFRRMASGICLDIKANGHSRKAGILCGAYEECDKQQERETAVLTVTESLSKIAERINDLKELLLDAGFRADR